MGAGVLGERVEGWRIIAIAALGLALLATVVMQIGFPLPATFAMVGVLIIVAGTVRPVGAAATFLFLLPLVLWLGRVALISSQEGLLSLKFSGGFKALLAGTALICVMRHWRSTLEQVLIKPILTFHLFLLVTCFYSTWPGFAVREWLLYLPGLALYLLASRGEKGDRTLRIAALGLWGGALIAGAIALSQVGGWTATRTMLGLSRVDGGFEHPNQFAMFLVAIILGLLHLGKPSPGMKTTVTRSISLLALLILLILSFSRTGWIVLVGALLLSSVFWGRKILTTFALLGLITLLTWNLIVPLVVERIQPDGAYYSRFKLIEVGIAMWRERPILGHGLGSFSVESREYLGSAAERYGIPVGLAPHNDLVRFAVEGGIVGLAFYLVLMFSILRLGLRLWRMDGEARRIGTYLSTLVAAVLAYGLAGQGFAYGAPYLMTIAGVAEVALRDEQSRKEPRRGEQG